MEMGQGGQAPPPPGGGVPLGGQPQPGYGQPTQAGYGQQQYQQGGGGAGGAAQQALRAVRSPETKPFFLTSEFIVWALTIILLLIAGAVTKAGEDGSDALPATTVWTLFTVISFAYVISRGISKAGQKYQGGDAGRGPGGL